MKNLIRVTLALIVVGAVFSLGRCSVTTNGTKSPAEDRQASADEETLWTCPMHAQVRLPDPVPCPICGMDLVRVVSGGEGPRQLVMSPDSKRLAGIVSAPVERKFVSMPVRMVGKIDFDETTVRTISAWVPGRLDRLYVDYTGVSVKQGEHLVWLYSPDLSSAQEELLSAKKRVSGPGDVSEFLADSDRRAYETARDKLMLWGLTESQVDEIERRGTAEDHVMLTSPKSGVIIRKEVDEGAYVETGTRIYSIADLDHLWVRLDAYEQDLPWLRYGQEVTIETEALPGETFRGRIIFLDPIMNERTRTVKVRVNIDNTDGRLKPGMFVRAVADARLASGGEVIEPSLAGKWICPMHPEVIKDELAQCDVCGMNLVPAEEHDMITSAQAVAEKPLVVPASAVLVTGKRAVVYVEDEQAEKPTYEGREIVLGPRAGEYYLVRSGLEEGERVVVHGAFRIDSSMQIKAKPSMMSMPGELQTHHGPEADHFRASLSSLQDSYFALQASLADDDLEAARIALGDAEQAFAAVSTSGLPSPATRVWSEEGPLIERGLHDALASTNIGGVRSGFHALSEGLLTLEETFGHAGEATFFEAYCPMAFDDRGASWLQRDDDLRNPYYGASMLRCGEVRNEYERIVARSIAIEADPAEEGEHDRSHDPVPNEPVDEPEEVDAPVEPAAESSSRERIAAVFDAYLALQESLASDDTPTARTAAADLLPRVEHATASSGHSEKVVSALGSLSSTSKGLSMTASIDDLRIAFAELSQSMIALSVETGNLSDRALIQIHCGMAFDDTGADWLQVAGKTANPYFGASMLRCGTVKRELEVK